MENKEEKTEIAGTEPLITIKGEVKYTLTFDTKGCNLEYEPQSDENVLVALLIAQGASDNARLNLKEAVKNNPKNMFFKDRLSWTAKTTQGLKILVESFMEIVTYKHSAKKPEITATPVKPTDIN